MQSVFKFSLLTLGSCPHSLAVSEVEGAWLHSRLLASQTRPPLLNFWMSLVISV